MPYTAEDIIRMRNSQNKSSNTTKTSRGYTAQDIVNLRNKSKEPPQNKVVVSSTPKQLQQPIKATPPTPQPTFNLKDVQAMDNNITDLKVDGKSAIKRPVTTPNYYSVKGEGTQKNNAMMLGAVDNTTLGGADLVNKGVNKITGQNKTAFDKAKEQQPDYYKKGEILGNIPLLATGIGADKLAANATKNIATKTVLGRIGKQVATDAIAGGGMALTEGILRQRDIKETAKNTVLGAGLGGLIGGGTKAIGEGLEMLAKSKPLLSNADNVGKKVIDEVASTKTNVVPKKLNLNVKDLPKGVQTKVSKFKTNTLTKTPELSSPQTQNIIKNTEMLYEVKPNASTVQKAKQALDTDFYGNVKRIMNSEGALSDAEDAAMVGLINKGLAKQAETTGDYKLFTDFVKKTRTKVTNTAQALQALKTWQMDSPEDVVLYAQKLMDTANNDMAKKVGNKFKGTEFSPDDIKFIHEKSKQIFDMPQGRAKEVAIGELRNYVGDKMPVSASDKIKSFVRMSMLSSPTTGLRNFVGNTLFNIAENVKQPISGAVDTVTSLFTKKRTTPILPDLGAQFKGNIEGATRQVNDLVKGIDTSKSSTATADMLDDKIGHTFKNPLMRKFEDYTKFLVRDDIFWQGAYNQRIKELQKLNKTDSITDDMIKQAKAFADERVFQNSTPLTEATLGMRKKAGLVGDVVLPFAKTPANIVSKTTDYLPVTGAYKIVKELHNATKGTFDQKRFVDLVGRVGLGSAITSLGYHLYNKGQLTLDPAKSRSEREFNKDIGKLPYSLKVNDKHIDISNYAPVASLLLAGAASAKKDMENGNKQNVDMITKLYDNSAAGLNSILDASYLKGLNQFFQDVQNPELGWTGAVTESIKGIPNMATPNIIKRLNYSLDPYARETYSENKGTLTDLKNSLLPNLPVASEKLPKKVNGFGEDMKRTNKPMGIVESLFNPFITAEKTKDPVKLEVDRLYQSSKETGILPEYDKYFEKIQYKGKTYQLTTDEKLQYKKLYGDLLMQNYKNVINSSEYQQSNSDDEKSQALKYLQQHIRDAVKQKILYDKLEREGNI